MIRDTHVKRFDGKEIAVRKWSKADGDWITTASGHEYFKYNRSEFIVDVPFVRGVKTVNGYIIKRPTLQRDLDMWYKPLFDYDGSGFRYEGIPVAITTGSLRQKNSWLGTTT